MRYFVILLVSLLIFLILLLLLAAVFLIMYINERNNRMELEEELQNYFRRNRCIKRRDPHVYAWDQND